MTTKYKCNKCGRLHDWLPMVCNCGCDYEMRPIPNRKKDGGYPSPSSR